MTQLRYLRGWYYVLVRKDCCSGSMLAKYDGYVWTSPDWKGEKNTEDLAVGHKLEKWEVEFRHLEM